MGVILLWCSPITRQGSRLSPLSGDPGATIGRLNPCWRGVVASFAGKRSRLSVSLGIRVNTVSFVSRRVGRL
jgi:hypothetical protein